MAREIHVTVQLDAALTAALRAQMDRIEAAVLSLTAKEGKFMAALDEQIATLTAQVSANTSVISSAKTLISGFSAQLATAISDAKGAGATPEQLKAISDLAAVVKANDDELAAAVAANTPVPAGTPPSRGV